MDAYVHLIVVLIYYSYHLLIRVANRHTHQSGKFSYAEIYVHYIVARLHFLQFFHGQCHLSAACGIRSEAVLMESVKNLMVCEDAYLHVVIGKASVERLVNRLK